MGQSPIRSNRPLSEVIGFPPEQAFLQLLIKIAHAAFPPSIYVKRTLSFRIGRTIGQFSRGIRCARFRW